MLLATFRVFSCGIQSFDCNMWGLVTCPGIKARHPALGAQSLSYWTIKGVPVMKTDQYFTFYKSGTCYICKLKYH